MKKAFLRSNWFLVASHVFAVAAGWGLWTGFGSELVPSTEEAERARSFRSSQRSGRSGEGRNAARILDDAAADPHFKVELKVKRVVSYHKRLEEAEKLLDAAEALAPAENVEAAAIGMLEALLADGKADDAGVRLLHWMEKDPKAALAWFGSKSKEQLGTIAPLLRNSMDALISSQGVEAAVGWMGSTARIDGEVVRMIADHGGATGDLQMMGRIKGGLEKQRWNDVRLSLVDTWPMAKADDLMKLSESEKAPLTILLYAKNQGPEGVEWLQKQLAGNTIDPAFRDSLLKHYDYHKLMHKSPQLDFEKRVEIVQSFEPGKPLEQIKYELGVYDVVDAMNGGRDWRYAFRNGTATADQIYQEMAKQLPEIASKSPESLKLQLFKELAEFGGPDAIRLLEGVPGDRKWELAMKAPQWNFLEANPDDFHRFISSIPADAGGNTWDVRLRAWESKVGSYDARLGPGSTEWVKNLPEGIDREMASYALLKRKEDTDPELAEFLKSRIKDPKIQRLINPETR